MDTGIGECVTIAPQLNPWARISEVAAKVGVEPIKFGHPATITAMGADGNAYDLWAVIIAVLDRMESIAVEQNIQPKEG